MISENSETTWDDNWQFCGQTIIRDCECSNQTIDPDVCSIRFVPIITLSSVSLSILIFLAFLITMFFRHHSPTSLNWVTYRSPLMIVCVKSIDPDRDFGDRETLFFFMNGVLRNFLPCTLNVVGTLIMFVVDWSWLSYFSLLFSIHLISLDLWLLLIVLKLKFRKFFPQKVEEKLIEESPEPNSDQTQNGLSDDSESSVLKIRDECT